MSIKKCKKCGNELNVKERKCPNCGYKLKRGGCFLILIAYLLTIVGVSYYANYAKEKEQKENTNSNIYSRSWRSPKNNEYATFGKIIVNSSISVCSEYKVKQINDDEYLIACTNDGENWNYFVINPTISQIYKAHYKITNNISPPR